MIHINNIDDYFRYGKGKTLSFYILDKELANILVICLPKKYEPYKLICSFENEENQYSYKIIELNEFEKYKEKGINEFYILSTVISPNFSLIHSGNIDKYLMYNGLIRILHGNTRKGKIVESIIMIIDKYIEIGKPENIFINKEYLEIFNSLKKSIKHILKYKSKLKWLDGRVTISKSNNISEDFAKNITKGLIKANVEVIE